MKLQKTRMMHLICWFTFAGCAAAESRPHAGQPVAFAAEPSIRFIRTPIGGTQEWSGGPRLFQAGPMVGHVSTGGAAIWLRAKIESRMEATAVQGAREYSPAWIDHKENGFRVLHFAGMKAATETVVRIRLSHTEFPAEEESANFRTAPNPGTAGMVRVAFGSCSKLMDQGSVLPVYDAIASEKPDFAILLGDNSYFVQANGGEEHWRTVGPVGDWDFLESMLARHLRTRVHSSLRKMLRTVPSYAIWDDHDYGPNNAGGTFPYKEEAALAFRTMWANPFYGHANIKGIFSSFRHGPVEVFLMDCRTHKYSPVVDSSLTPETGSIWGQAQLDWLLLGLRTSTAPIKLIANGTQVLTADTSGEGHHLEATGERNRLLNFLADNKIGGVIILSGDRHHSEAMQWVQPDGTLVLEFTSSPMFSQSRRDIGPLEPERIHANQVWGMRGPGYGLLRVETSAETLGIIHFEARNDVNETARVNGEVKATTWKLDELIYPPDSPHLRN